MEHASMELSPAEARLHVAYCCQIIKQTSNFAGLKHVFMTACMAAAATAAAAAADHVLDCWSEGAGA